MASETKIWAGALAVLAMIAAAIWHLGGGFGLRAQESCGAPRPVCGAASAVFHISAFERFASGVRISANELVATRRAVADRERVTIHLKNGETVEGQVVPNGFRGDLVLIRAALPGQRWLQLAPEIGEALYVVGLDRATRSIEVFQRGGPIMPLRSQAVGAHLHHDAGARPGSGAAVVDGNGALVAIQVATNNKRSEAVPAHHIAALRAASGPAHKQASAALGRGLSGLPDGHRASCRGRRYRAG